MRLNIIATVMLLTLPAVAAAEVRVSGESLVLAGTTPGKLLYRNVRPDGVVVRSTYLPDKTATIYEAGRDYVVDAAAGTISRTSTSRIPDFATNVLYGKRDFDHSQFPGYGNLPFTVYVDYASDDTPIALAEPTDATVKLARTGAALRSGKPLKIVAFGDSITAGGEASSVELQYPFRYAAHLRATFPSADVTVENGATGGDNTEQGVARLEEKVLSRKPDLVLVAFGMNDHNRGGVDVDRFADNLRTIVTRIREKTGADVILLSTFPPNPDWHFGSKRMEQYAAVTQRVANEMNVAYADVHAAWMKVLDRKDAASLLANHINHPNDFGHWLYAEVLKSLKF